MEFLEQGAFKISEREEFDMRKGFTLIELFVTILIMAVLAALAFPGYSKTIQKREASQAATYLRAIRLAEKMYYSRNGTYACISSCGNASAIKTALGVEVADGHYVFTVAATSTTFSVTATGYTKTIILDQDGNWTGTYSPLPPS